jgi:hypothetical protein
VFKDRRVLMSNNALLITNKMDKNSLEIEYMIHLIDGSMKSGSIAPIRTG